MAEEQNILWQCGGLVATKPAVLTIVTHITAVFPTSRGYVYDVWADNNLT